jgi:hypothetical protein
MNMGPILVSETARALTLTVGTATAQDGCYRPKTQFFAGCRRTWNCLIHFHRRIPLRIFLQTTVRSFPGSFCNLG